MWVGEQSASFVVKLPFSKATRYFMLTDKTVIVAKPQRQLNPYYVLFLKEPPYIFMNCRVCCCGEC